MSSRARSATALGLTALVLLTGGCQLERLQPERVADGAARLTVLGLSTLLQLINADERCGFASASVQERVELQGTLGAAGAATWAVQECTLDLGALSEAGADCLGESGRIGGAVTVSATRSVEGVLTGGGDPVLPLRADAVVIALQAQLKGFEVETADGNRLGMLSGSIEALARPHLAVGVSSQACSVVGPDLSLDQIRYRDATLAIASAEAAPFEVEVPRSDISAQIGAWSGRENALEGSIRVWDVDVQLPADGEGLDPEYDREDFLERHACDQALPDLQRPLSYGCPDQGPRLAQGVSRLSVQLLGAVADQLDRDASCGFSSVAVQGSAVATGSVGEAGGTLVTSVTDPCEIHFAPQTGISADCLGGRQTAGGRIRAAGSSTIHGILTGDPETPVVPTSWMPAEAQVEAEFEDFELRAEGAPHWIKVRSGRLSGQLSPRTILDTKTGACSAKIPVVSFTGLRWQDAVVELHTGARVFLLRIEDSDLNAQSGQGLALENHLEGEITIDGRPYAIPTDGEPVLDPDYDRARYADSYLCAPNVAVPASAQDCSFARRLGLGASRLLIQNLGAITALVNASEEGGFSDTANVLLFPVSVDGEPGEAGALTHRVEQCRVGAPQALLSGEDCHGERSYAQGEAVIDATRTVTGEREELLWLVQSVVPRDPEAVRLNFSAVELYNFSAYALAPGAQQPEVQLTLHQGLLSAEVQPFRGEMASEPGRFDVSTPILAVRNLLIDRAEATLLSGAMTFRLEIRDLRLDAQNGVYAGQGNYLEGELNVNGERVVIERTALDPDYDQVAFDASYACTPDLAAVLPPS